MYWKRIKAVSFVRWYDYPHRKFSGVYLKKRTPRTVSKFNKVAGYKISTKSVVSIC